SARTSSPRCWRGVRAREISTGCSSPTPGTTSSGSSAHGVDELEDASGEDACLLRLVLVGEGRVVEEVPGALVLDEGVRAAGPLDVVLELAVKVLVLLVEGVLRGDVHLTGHAPWPSRLEEAQREAAADHHDATDIVRPRRRDPLGHTGAAREADGDEGRFPRRPLEGRGHLRGESDLLRAGAGRLVV